MKRLILTFTLIFTTLWVTAQNRYFDEIFEDVNTTESVVYGNNMNYLPYLVFGNTLAQDLEMDIYESVGDDMEERPVVLVIHTGNFLPIVTNGSTSGERTDSSIVSTCRQLAKRGFVAIAMDYRLGWNPLSDLRSVRTGTLINAAYRGVQDVRTCLRYLRKSVAEEGNPYAIDTSRMGMMGQGTGGYITYAVATLDKQEEMEYEKFQFVNEDGIVDVYVKQERSGDLEGLGFPDPEQENGFIETDTTSSQVGNFITLNKPNHIGYSSEVHFGFAYGGALASIDWIDENSSPFAACHAVKDPNAPFFNGVLIVPTTEEEVINVDGAGRAIPAWNASGANDVLLDTYFLVDEYSNTIRDNNLNIEEEEVLAEVEGQEHIWAITSDTISGPWDWWDLDAYDDEFNADNLLGNPDMSPEKGRAYLDTVINYFVPRFVVATELPVEGLDFWAVGLEDVEQGVANVGFYPNPARTNIMVGSNDGSNLTAIEIFDIQGKLIFTHEDINASEFLFQRNGLSDGTYLLKIHTTESISTHKLVLR